MKTTLRTFALTAVMLTGALFTTLPATAGGLYIGVRVGGPGRYTPPPPPLPPPPASVYHYRGNHHPPANHVWVEGRWVLPPFPGAVWVAGYHTRRGHWVPGYWVNSCDRREHRYSRNWEYGREYRPR